MKDFEQSLKDLQEELISVNKELVQEHLDLVRYFKRTGSLSYYSNYNELNSRRKKILIKINQIRLKHWYWKQI